MVIGTPGDILRVSAVPRGVSGKSMILKECDIVACMFKHNGDEPLQCYFVFDDYFLVWVVPDPLVLGKGVAKAYFAAVECNVEEIDELQFQITRSEPRFVEVPSVLTKRSMFQTFSEYNCVVGMKAPVECIVVFEDAGTAVKFREHFRRISFQHCQTFVNHRPNPSRHRRLPLCHPMQYLCRRACWEHRP